MNRRLAGALIAVILLFGGLAFVYVLRQGDQESPATSTPESARVVPRAQADLEAATLYFPDEAGTLSAEQRSLPAAPTPEGRARLLLEAVLAGPTEPGLAAPFPEGTSLGVTHLAPTGVLYVDLLSDEDPRPPAQGSEQELVSVYSLVNTILVNETEIDSVILLWNGRQPSSFAGHVDTSLPLRADRDLLARRP